MQRFKDEGEVISRLLTDTQYMSRIAKEYMNYVSGPENVWAIPGQLTALLRSKWGLNELLSDNKEKNRKDHRHHAIDAFVVACTSRSMLQKIARASKKTRKRFIEKMPPPFKNFEHKEIEKLLDEIIISFKPDHGFAQKAIKEGKTVGQLHDETAYGFVSEDIEKEKITLSVRKDPSYFKSKKQVQEIADERFKEYLLNKIENKSDTEIKTIIEDFFKTNGIRKLKIHLEKDKKTVIPIKDKDGKIYKYYTSGNNYCADIYCSHKTEKAGKWQIEIIPVFYAHQPKFEPAWHKKYPTAKKIMRLFINDMVAWDENGLKKILRVKKMNVDGRLFFQVHKIAKSEKESNATSVKQLQERNARKIGIDIIGRIYDPLKKNENS
ncbi:MAG TPA: hypothetical protein ENL20_07700 [Candidatus Cloacimonetes bacterium]|nr:hypothetical protein [Candidatus Cloacimonadota bacterium]